MGTLSYPCWNQLLSANINGPKILKQLAIAYCNTASLDHVWYYLDWRYDLGSVNVAWNFE